MQTLAYRTVGDPVMPEDFDLLAEAQSKGYILQLEHIKAAMMNQIIDWLVRTWPEEFTLSG